MRFDGSSISRLVTRLHKTDIQMLVQKIIDIEAGECILELGRCLVKSSGDIVPLTLCCSQLVSYSFFLYGEFSTSKRFSINFIIYDDIMFISGRKCELC